MLYSRFKKQQKDISNSDYSMNMRTRLSQQMKKFFFKCSKAFIADNPIPNWLRYIMYTIETMQLMKFGFDNQIAYLWKDDIATNWLYKFSNLFTFRYYVTDSFDNYIIVTYICQMMVFAVTFNIGILFLFDLGKRQSAAVSQNIYILRLFCQIMPQILYLPKLELFFYIFQCQLIDGNYQHIALGQKCFSGNYVVHMAFALMAIIALFLLNMYISRFIVDFRLCSNNITSRSNGDNEVSTMLFKSFLVFNYTLFNHRSNKNSVLVIIIYVSSATLLFCKINKNQTYNFLSVYKLALIQVTISLWTAYMIAFCLVMDNTLFDGGVYAWGIGTVFLIWLIIVKREQRIDLLLLNTNKLSSPRLLDMQLKYLGGLVKQLEYDKDVNLILDGFIDYHKTICSRQDCPSRSEQYSTHSTKFHKLTSKFQQNSSEVQFIRLVESFYQLGINNFPHDTQLRISYILFLLDRLNMKQQALQELINLEGFKTSWFQEFQLSLLKSTVEEEVLNDMQADHNTHNTNETTYQQYIQQMRKAIENNTNLHMEFWTQLREDTPDLVKLMEAGTLILDQNKIIEEMWVYMRNMNDHIPSVLRVYASYCLNIGNDRWEAERVLSCYELFDSDNINHVQQNEGDIGQLSQPLIIISGEDENQGIITNINQAAASLFAYSKTELVNRKVNGLMPQLYGQHHDSFLTAFNQSQEARIINREVLMPIKNRMNYVMPYHLVVSQLNSVVLGFQYVAHIKKQPQYKTQCYLIVEKENGMIENISASAINILGLSLTQIEKQTMKITDILPNFFQNTADYLNKLGTQTIVNLVLEKNDSNPSVAAQRLMQVVAQEINFKLHGMMGYMIRLEPIKAHQDNQTLISKLALENQKNWQYKRRPVFTMRYVDEKFYEGDLTSLSCRLSNHGIIKVSQDCESPKNMGENWDTWITRPTMNSKMELGQSEVGKSLFGEEDKVKAVALQTHHSNNDNSRLLSILMESQLEEKQQVLFKNQVRKDLGSGIRTMRLWNNRILDVEDMRRMESDEEDESEKIHEDQLNNLESGHDQIDHQDLSSQFSNYFKSKANYAQFIKDRNQLSNIQLLSLQILPVVILIIYLCLGASNFIVINSEIQETNTWFDHVQKSAKRVNLVQMSLMTTLKMHQICNVFNSTATEASSQFIYDEKIEFLNKYVEELQIVHNELTKLQFNFDNKQLTKLLSTNLVKIYYKEMGVKVMRQYDVNEATKQIISKILVIKAIKKKDFLNERDIYYFLNYNLMNDYFLSIQAVNSYFNMELEKRAKNAKFYQTMMLILSFFIVLSLLGSMFPMYNHIQNIQAQIMRIFLDIPLYQVRRLQIQAEAFGNSLLMDEEKDDTGGEESSNVQEEEESSLKTKKNRKERKSRAQGKNKARFLFQATVICVAIQTYFVLDYLVAGPLEDFQSRAVNEMHLVGEIQYTSAFTWNAIYNYVNHPEIYIYEIYPLFILQEINADTLKLVNQLETHTLDNRDYYPTLFVAELDLVMHQGVCSLVAGRLKTHTEAQCHADYFGIVQEGMKVALISQIQNNEAVIKAIEYYSELANRQSPYLHNDEQDPEYIFQNNITLNNFIQTLSSGRFQRNYHVRQQYMFDIFDYLNSQFLLMLRQGYTNTLSYRLTLFICFVLYLIFMFLFYWLPSLARIQSNILKAKTTLVIIPVLTIQQSMIIREKLTKIFNMHT